MKLLVFQHIECEHPGILRSFLAEDDIQWHAVELDAGDTVHRLVTSRLGIEAEPESVPAKSLPDGQPATWPSG